MEPNVLEKAQKTQGEPPYELSVACFNDQHKLVPTSHDDALQRVRDMEGATWIHVVAHDRDKTSALLENEFGFHPVAVEDALTDDERPELREFDDHLFLVLPSVTITKGTEDYDEIGVFLKPHVLVTVSHRPVPAVDVLIKRIESKKMSPDHRTAFFMYMIIDAIVDSYFPIIDNIEDEIDDLADQIYSGETKRLRELLKYKRRLLELRRRLSPLRDVINSALRRDLEVIPDDLRPFLHDAFDNALRLTEIVDMNRDTLTSLLDVHLSAVSNNLNEIMKKMTVISTVLMTGALIAGIYGMNFKHMPELEWYWGYPAALGLMVVLSIAILYFFRKNRWI